MIARDTDRTNDWHEAADAAPETRTYYVHNWRGDVVSVHASSGDVTEQYRYTAYGVPIRLSLADADGDGYSGTSDLLAVLTDQGTSTNQATDFNRDGITDGADSAMYSSEYGSTGHADGYGELARGDGDTHAHSGGRKGYASYEHSFFDDSTMHVRYRVYDAELGRWTSRDPAGYVDGKNVYGYVRMGPVVGIDPMGLRHRRPSAPVECAGCGTNVTAGANTLLTAVGEVGWLGVQPLLHDRADVNLTIDPSCDDSHWGANNCLDDELVQRALRRYEASCGSEKPLRITCDLDEDSDNYGEWHCEDDLIKVKKSENRCSTYAHEIIHAADECQSPRCDLPSNEAQDCLVSICAEARAASFGHCCDIAGHFRNNQSYNKCLLDTMHFYLDRYEPICPQARRELKDEWERCEEPDKLKACPYTRRGKRYVPDIPDWP